MPNSFFKTLGLVIIIILARFTAYQLPKADAIFMWVMLIGLSTIYLSLQDFFD